MAIYRTASLSELRIALDWAAAEGWNPGLDDAEAFFATDPDGFFVAEEQGKVVGSVSVVNHTSDFAFLGLYIVRPDHRGQGIGYGLWSHAIAHAGDRTIGLDGVPDQQANYAISGFEWFGETVRFQGDVPVVRSTAIRAASEADIASLSALEAHGSGWSKPHYLSQWFRACETRSTWILEDIGQIIGSATVRRCREGVKIGPLMARDQTGAEALIGHVAGIYGGPINIDVPASSVLTTELCQSLGLEPVFGTARMYRGPAPRPGDPFFTVTTLELG